ncbi:OLC1v1015091C1 [Oldenlandia corymbosa var. corymbosa]|uniref:OLC1v1015091C1 n=1 Tax=Oldenlandia corymbosa var. corymbosa TaxID=529605 RepID=A0AAV1E4M2_OLDCO|nr:OLC1v1015091C1 [Oldenlandia corymbosa var. corymbosa]
MAQMLINFFTLLSFALLQIQGSHGLDYIVENKVPNSRGGQRFDREMGVDYVRNVLKNSTEFIWKVFNQKSMDETRGHTQVSWYLDKVDQIAVTVGNETKLSASFVQNFTSFEGCDLKTEVSAIMFHENTQVWQWFGNNKNVGVIEGIANYMMIVAGLAPGSWLQQQPGENERWDAGYIVTARFFVYLESLKGGRRNFFFVRLPLSKTQNLEIGNLDDTIDDDKLKKLFSEFGTIAKCKVAKMNGKMVVSKPLDVAFGQQTGRERFKNIRFTRTTTKPFQPLTRRRIYLNEDGSSFPPHGPKFERRTTAMGFAFEEGIMVAADHPSKLMVCGMYEEAREVARRRILIWHKKNGANPLPERRQGVDPAARAPADYLSMLALQKGSRDNIYLSSL